MEEIWQEHKNFILTCVGGAVVFFTAWMIVTGSIEQEIASNVASASSHDRKARQATLPSGLKSEVERRLEELKEQLAALEGELAFRPNPGFTLAGATKASDIHFNEVVQRLLVQIVEPAATLDIRIPPDLGLAGVTPRTEVEREWYLNGLDIVHRICVAAIAAQVESVEPIQIEKMPKAKREATDAPDYLTAVPVTFHARGSPAAIDALVRGLSLPAARLSIESARINSLEAAKKDRRTAGLFTDGMVSLEMKVRALRIDPEGEPARWPTARR